MDPQDAYARRLACASPVVSEGPHSRKRGRHGAADTQSDRNGGAAPDLVESAGPRARDAPALPRYIRQDGGRAPLSSTPAFPTARAAPQLILWNFIVAQRQKRPCRRLRHRENTRRAAGGSARFGLHPGPGDQLSTKALFTKGPELISPGIAYPSSPRPNGRVWGPSKVGLTQLDEHGWTSSGAAVDLTPASCVCRAYA